MTNSDAGAHGHSYPHAPQETVASSAPASAQADSHHHPHAAELAPAAHPHKQDHSHAVTGLKAILRDLNPFHAHAHTVTDSILDSSEKGIRAVQISLLVLGATAAFQVVVVLASGSVALLADTIHNFTDALTALPLWLAFALSRRPASRRFTYGHGRTEDLAGAFIVLIILASALLAGYESYRKILDPAPLRNIEWVMAAAVIGFIGNEAVAIFRTRVGREIGSAALVADGHHARVDGLTSLAVLLGAIGVLAGFKLADPLIGALITFAILFILKDAALLVGPRLLDAVHPDLVHELEHAAQATVENESQAHGINGIRIRWLGHRLQAELNLVVDGELSTQESHRLAEAIRHALYHALPQLNSVIVHVDPRHDGDEDPHSGMAHHLPLSSN